VHLIQPDYAETILELDDALKRLEKEGHTRVGKALELKYFGGLSSDEVAKVLVVSRSSVTRDLRFTGAWLAREWRGDLDLLETG